LRTPHGNHRKLKVNAGVRVARQSYSFHIGNGYFQGGVQILPLTSTKSTPVNPAQHLAGQSGPAALCHCGQGQLAGGANRPIPASRCAADIAQNGLSPKPMAMTRRAEGGMKGRFLGGKLSVSGSGFHLKWKNVQQNLSARIARSAMSAISVTPPASGFDLSVTARPATWATITAMSAIPRPRWTRT
jgi:hypothetical protein